MLTVSNQTFFSLGIASLARASETKTTTGQETSFTT